jgi:hypothetical protein
MNKMLGFIGMTIGGYAGWAVGERISFAAALLLGIVGTGLGLYLARKIFSDHF